MNVLFVVNELSTVCGITKHLIHLITGLKSNSDYSYFILAGRGDDAIIKKFENLNVSVMINKNLLHQQRTLLRFILAILQVTKFVKKKKITIIHSHFYYNARISEFVKIFGNVKTVNTYHGIVPNKSKINQFPANSIITVNEHTFEYVKKQTNGKHVYLVRNGINEYSFISPKANKMIVVVASRLVYDKGIDIFIKAVSLLPKSITEQVDFIIAGDGEDKRDYLKLNTELNTKIKFIGIVENTQELLNKSHILVNPTCSKEGFPTILVEAGLQKNLIVSSNFFGHDFILKDKENCLIFNQGDIISLKEKLIIAINEYSSNEEIIDKFYSQCKKLYSVEGMIKKIKRIYEFAQ